jgi:hypothetical protein
MQITMDTNRVKPMVVIVVRTMAVNSFEPEQIYNLTFFIEKNICWKILKNV